MTKSPDELELRAYVVEQLRRRLPSARIIHELNVAGTGSNRIDVAAVTETAIVAVELKSKRDKLDRLSAQLEAFQACCHVVIVAAHEKHFVPAPLEKWESPPREGEVRDLHLNQEPFLRNRYKHKTVWRYPPPDPQAPSSGLKYVSMFNFASLAGVTAQPKASRMLDMLWAEELRDECRRHRVACDSRSVRAEMIHQLAWHLTGQEIARAVCRQLRMRVFAEADPPIGADAVAVPGTQAQLSLQDG